MSNESFGLLFIIVVGLLILGGIGSLIISCFLDKITLNTRKHYFKPEIKNDTLESASVIFNDDNKSSFDLNIEDIE